MKVRPVDLRACHKSRQQFTFGSEPEMNNFWTKKFGGAVRVRV